MRSDLDRRAAAFLALVSLTGCSGEALLQVDPPQQESACITRADERVRVVDIATGTHTACALTSRGTMLCWGDTGFGVAGNSEYGSSVCEPTLATAHSCLATIAVGSEAGCGLRRDGRVVCWGDNEKGALGVSGPSSSWKPVELPVEGAVEVAKRGIAAARLAHGEVLFWGGNPFYGYVDPQLLYPGLVAAALPESGFATCVITPQRTLLCWGSNYAGQVGDGTTTDRDDPTPVLQLSDVAGVSVGMDFACARGVQGLVWCWGRGGYLGDGTLDSSVVPLQLPLPQIVQLSSNTHTCALAEDGRVFCWGCPNYRGDWCGSADPVLLPKQVSQLPPVSKVSVGFNYTCALTVDAEVYCWGLSPYCETGIAMDSVVPRKVDFPILQ